MFLQGLGSDLIAKVSTHLVDKREFGRLLVTCQHAKRSLEEELEKRKKAWIDVRLLQFLQVFHAMLCAPATPSDTTPDFLYRTYEGLDMVTHAQGETRLTHGSAGTGARSIMVHTGGARKELCVRITEFGKGPPPESRAQTVRSYHFCMHPTLRGEHRGDFVRAICFLTPSPENPVTIASRIITSVDDLIRLAQSNELRTHAIVMPE